MVPDDKLARVWARVVRSLITMTVGVLYLLRSHNAAQAATEGFRAKDAKVAKAENERFASRPSRDKKICAEHDEVTR